MTDERKTNKPEKQIGNLELNRETVQDLTESEADQAKGGQNPNPCSKCDTRGRSCLRTGTTPSLCVHC